VGAVKAHAHRGVRALRNLLDDEFDFAGVRNERH
jgi:DNA-directed RNA polymerase specialized sigma24 family protein